MRWVVFTAIVAGGVATLGTHSAPSDKIVPATPAPPSPQPQQMPQPIVSTGKPKGVPLCGKRVIEVASDGRLLNHFHYSAASKQSLGRPFAKAGGNCRAMHQDAIPDLKALLIAATKALGPSLYAASCHRNEAYQETLFCGAKSRGIPAEQRAESVAPPGYSEHHTGYAVDFGATPAACNFRDCFGSTKSGKWLLANAPSFGFELSFPPGNGQGVSSEPWHWRWVGHGNGQGDAQARDVFGTARTRFPSNQTGQITANH